MQISIPIRLLILSLVLAIYGCATIPKEAPELSMELGNRISAIEDANVVLLHRYFDFKREQVDRFISEVWVPLFATNVMGHEATKAAWDQVVRSKDPQMAFDFIVDVGPQLQVAINEKRLELVDPLNSLEREIEDKIRAEYHQARAINNTLTSFLTSSAKVAENRQRYLDMIGVSDERISNALDKTDETVSALLKAGNSVQDATVAAPKYLKKLKEIKNSVRKAPANREGE